MNSTDPLAGAILVDVDDTVSGRTAIDWAIEEGERRGVPVRVLPGRARERLLAESRHASLIVVGSQRFMAMTDLAHGSVAMDIATHADVPVVVVRPGTPDAIPSRSAGRVVVGVDGTGLSEPAMEFAFAEAERRRCGLTLMHAIEYEAERPVAEKMLTELVDRHRPDVDVRTVVTPDSAGHALVAESAGAVFVVVGSRGHGGLAGMLLGSVSQAVVHRAHCPVVVVRAATGPKVPPGR